MVVALDNLVEERGPVLNRLGEDLEQVALIVVVDQDVQALNHVHVFCYVDTRGLESLAQVLIVSSRYGQELNAACLHLGDGVNDIVGAHGDVLHTGPAVVVDILLDLALAFSWCGLVDRHLDVLVEVAHHDGPERRVLGVDHRVINRPVAVEVEHVLVPLRNGFHLEVRLVADDVVQLLKHWGVHEHIHLFLHVVRLEPRQEGSVVVLTLDQRVDRVAVGLDLGGDHFSILVLHLKRLLNTLCTTSYSLLVKSTYIVN